MMRAGDYIIKQGKLLLENKQHAILCAIALSIIPFASWLSVALVVLITLRKGPGSGLEVLLPALVIHSVPLMILVPVESAIINTLIAYIPCFIAALSLRYSKNWQIVFGVFLFQAFMGFLLIQLMVPDFIATQFNQFKSLLGQFQEYKQLVASGTEGISSFILAQLFFGVQMLSVVVSATISLMFARSIQAKLFKPGGFKKEILEFRGGRISFLVLTGILLGSYYEIPCAINLLPLILFCFLMSGFNLAYFVLARKKQTRLIILLFLIIFLKPLIILFAFIVFGSLDSLFNFRLYLPVRVTEST